MPSAAIPVQAEGKHGQVLSVEDGQHGQPRPQDPLLAAADIEDPERRLLRFVCHVFKLVMSMR